MDRDTLMKFKSLFEQELKNLVYSQEIINADFHIQKDDLLDETDMTSNGYATGGSMSDGTWLEHQLAFTWTAPSTPGDYELWVTIEDGTGGSAVWRAISHVQ